MISLNDQSFQIQPQKNNPAFMRDFIDCLQ